MNSFCKENPAGVKHPARNAPPHVHRRVASRTDVKPPTGRFRKWVRPLLAHPVIRFLLVHYYYRDVIRSSERVFQLRRKLEQQGESFWANDLRKHAHILDKGLQRCDWEPGHSAAAYDAARHAMSKIHSEDLLGDASIQWAGKKIQEYEGRRACHPTRTTFARTSCSYEDLVDVMKTRRSIRRFKKHPVDDSTIRKIVDVINWSPTSCHRQTAKVYISNDPDRVRKCMDLCAGSSGFGDYIPLFFCFCSDMRAYQMPVELSLPFIDVSLGIQNCTLVAHTLGISLTLMSWAQSTEKEDRRMRKLLRIPADDAIIVNAVGGYPACGADIPARKSLTSTMTLISEKNHLPNPVNR